MSNGAERIKRRLGSIGIDWDELVGMAVSYFVTKQDPEEVEFTKHPNGWRVTIKTDEESAQEAKEFWESNIEERL